MKRTTERDNRKRLRLIQAASAFLLLLFLGCLAWGSSGILHGDPGASVMQQRGKSAEEIQRELDEATRNSLMTISVAPAPALKDDQLRVNVENDKSNRFGQRFSLIQDGKRLYGSKTIEPGKTVEFCPAGKAHVGKAIVEVQAVDLKTNHDHGNPTRVQVSICAAEDK